LIAPPAFQRLLAPPSASPREPHYPFSILDYPPPPMLARPIAILLALCPLAAHGADSSPPVKSDTSPKKANRLSKEKSPYLLQHQYNPVDWYPWGEEAFAKAKKENKPALLTIR